MKVTPTEIADVLIIEPKVFGDDRGFFLESYNSHEFSKVVNYDVTFVQDNHSHSKKSVLRGLHYQIQQPQGKLVRVITGKVLDVAVDIRRSSATFGKWVSVVLSADNKHQLWVPPGFAHGFIVLSETADFLYKTTDYYFPEYERCICWNDTELAIDWQFHGQPTVSEKDARGTLLADAELFE